MKKDLQLELIRALAKTGISETVTLAVASVMREDALIIEFADRLLAEEEKGSEMSDGTVTKVLMGMIHEAYSNSSEKNK
ncbi:MAG: hypothetical protein PUD55_03035 [Firmicutes bacterium]|nr:hypothetical protein [Bacillota bacterium]